MMGLFMMDLGRVVGLLVVHGSVMCRLVVHRSGLVVHGSMCRLVMNRSRLVVHWSGLVVHRSGLMLHWSSWAVLGWGSRLVSDGTLLGRRGRLVSSGAGHRQM